jgi:RimJ/RimL family protein N-acetyltransferase
MLDDCEPIFQFECNEPTGKYIRIVRQLVFDKDNLAKLWEKVRQFPTLFGQAIVNDQNKFIDKLMAIDSNGNISGRGLIWVVDDFVGIYYLTDIIFGDSNFPEDALVHYSFFDRRHHGRSEMTKSFIRYVFNKYQFNRLTANIPMYSTPQTFSFVEDLGFKYEGRKRKCCSYKGDLFDMKTFGILKSEV